MADRTCRICGVSIVHKRSDASYCSDACNSKAYRDANPGLPNWKVRNKERARAYRIANPDRPEKVNARTRAYRKRHPERATAHKYGRKLKAPYTREALDYRELIAGDPCVYCGGEGGTVDHIVAISVGGTSDWNNLASACRSCNARKQARSLLAFLLDLRLAS